MKWLSLMLIVFIKPINTYAQKNEQDSIKLIELSEAVITTKVYNKKNTITKKDIDKLNTSKDIPTLLQAMPAVVTTSDAGNSVGYAGLRLRGTDITRLNVTLNGVPVNDAESHSVYFVNFPDIASSANEITITPGVKSSKNGSSNFGGAISINTIQQENNTTAAKYAIDYGSFNTLKQTLQLQTALLKQKWVSSIRLSKIKSDGYIQRSKADLQSLQLTSTYNIDASTQVSATVLKGLEITQQAWNGVPLDSLKSNRKHNELGLKSDGTFYNNQIDHYAQDYYQLFFDKKINQHFNIGSTLYYTKGKGYYEEFKQNHSYASYGLPDKIIGSDTITNTDLIRQLWLNNDFYGIRLYTTYTRKKMDVGLYFNANNYKGKHDGIIKWSSQGTPNDYNWYHLTSQKTDINTYVMWHYYITPKCQLYADLQYRHVQYDIYGFRNNPSIVHALTYPFINPKVKGIYSFNSKNNVQLTMGIAQKEPNRDDIEATKISIPKHEKLTDIELEYTGIVKKNIYVNVNTYYMKYKNQLVLTGKINDVGAYTRTNVDNSYRLGVELQASAKLNPMFTLKGNISWSKNKILNFNNYIDDYDQGIQQITFYKQSTIAFSPTTVSATTIVIYPFIQSHNSPFKNTTLDINTKYVSKQYLDNLQSERKVIKAYSTTDVIANSPLHIHNIDVTLRAAVFNVFNKMYESNGYTYSYIYGSKLETYNYFFPQAGIHFGVGFTVGL